MHPASIQLITVMTLSSFAFAQTTRPALPPSDTSNVLQTVVGAFAKASAAGDIDACVKMIAEGDTPGSRERLTKMAKKLADGKDQITPKEEHADGDVGVVIVLHEKPDAPARFESIPVAKIEGDWKVVLERRSPALPAEQRERLAKTLSDWGTPRVRELRGPATRPTTQTAS